MRKIQVLRIVIYIKYRSNCFKFKYCYSCILSSLILITYYSFVYKFIYRPILHESPLNSITNSKKKNSNSESSFRNKPQLQKITTSNKKKNNKLSSFLSLDLPNISLPVISVLILLLLSCHTKL